MLKKIAIGLLCTIASISSTAYSMVSHLQSGVTVEFELLPNEPQLFINYMFWPIEANCVIKSEDMSNELFIEALVKTGKVNGIPLLAGETMRLTIHNGYNLKLLADSGSKVRITNFGAHKIKAFCTT